MTAWNLVVSVRSGCFSRALGLLREVGPVHKTDYYNIVTMEVPRPAEATRRLREVAEREGEQCPFVHVVPVEETFSFNTPEEFARKAREAIANRLERLDGRRFHVRMHRRGFRGRISSLTEEQQLDRYILEELRKSGGEGAIDFTDPDAVVLLEMVGNRCGITVVERDELERNPLLGLVRH